MRLLVGLGNPGLRYQATRHNVGFDALDRLLSTSGGQWNLSRHDAVAADVRIEHKRVTLLKPLTYMNLSGGPVAAFAAGNAIEPREVCVYYDDVALPLGALRLRERGSAGGHNGLASVLEALGGEDVARVRIGILPRANDAGSKTDFPGDLAEFVLSPFTPEERPVIDEALSRVVAATKAILTDGMAKAMSRFNAVDRPDRTANGKALH